MPPVPDGYLIAAIRSSLGETGWPDISLLGDDPTFRTASSADSIYLQRSKGSVPTEAAAMNAPLQGHNCLTLDEVYDRRVTTKARCTG